jgi:glycosyltransferase involved in cell wall biosynthesis
MAATAQLKTRVSVIMSVYNGEEFLRYSVDSILNQSFKDFEFIIVNDGSVDRTEEIIKSYKDPRIVYICNKENIGVPLSLNMAIRRAHGCYIAVMDHDDISLPDRLFYQYNYMEDNEDVFVLATDVNKIDTRNNIIGKWSFPKSPDIKVWCLCYKLTGWNWLTHSSLMMRRQMFEEIGFYDPDYEVGHDADLLYRAMRKYKIEIIHKPLVNYRIHKNSLCSKKYDVIPKEQNAILVSNINFYLKDRNLEDKEIIWRILSLKRQKHNYGIKKIFEIFDYYFEAISRDCRDNNLELLRAKAKMAYLPRLFKASPIMTSGLLIRLFLTYPQILFSRDFLYILAMSNKIFGIMYKRVVNARKKMI